ncbi:non-structural maintenance of chromosomes element 4 homolog A-like [Primulina huaijiensis]|uniref:non-structural maintenance of chromosomes element 4 homolog A-like n=1 Tax=Primulina huaijiensis TaxID=1492673 RepID=UPI003CC749AB
MMEGMSAMEVKTQEEDILSKNRTIRSYYREIENRVNEEKDEIAHVYSDKFMVIMNEVETMHQHVSKPREQVADAETLLGLTSSLVASVKMHISGGVTPAEFLSCLIREFGRQKSIKGIAGAEPIISWKNIGDRVSSIFMNGHSCMTMIGPMKNELKQRKLTVRAKRSRTKGKSRPEELEKVAEVITDTDRNMLTMFDVLKKEKKTKVENLMFNRNSFAQTVENLFALSFLVKDGRVHIDVDENGSQIAMPRNGPSAEDIENGVVTSHQFIFRFDFDDWKLKKSHVPEGKELMPHRDAIFGEAKQEPNCKGFSQVDSISNGSQPIYTLPVKKFSRNFGRFMQLSELTEVGYASCKRKRSQM